MTTLIEHNPDDEIAPEQPTIGEEEAEEEPNRCGHCGDELPEGTCSGDFPTGCAACRKDS